MTRYSTDFKDSTFVKGYGFLSFVKSMNKNFSERYSQKLFDHAIYNR